MQANAINKGLFMAFLKSDNLLKISNATTQDAMVPTLCRKREKNMPAIQINRITGNKFFMVEELMMLLIYGTKFTNLLFIYLNYYYLYDRSVQRTYCKQRRII